MSMPVMEAGNQRPVFDGVTVLDGPMARIGFARIRLSKW